MFMPVRSMLYSISPHGVSLGRDTFMHAGCNHYSLCISQEARLREHSASTMTQAAVGRIVTGGLLAWLLGGCGALQALPLFQPKITLNELHFKVDPRANGTTPFAVDLVAVQDEALRDRLLALSAEQWFDAQSNDLPKTFPNALSVWHYEMPPGGRLDLKPTPFGGKRGRALLLFAGYRGKGAYRLRLDGDRRATVLFGEKDIATEKP